MIDYNTAWVELVSCFSLYVMWQTLTTKGDFIANFLFYKDFTLNR